MKLVGLDIGTTTICGLLLDPETGDIVSVVTEPNASQVTGGAPWEACQDPQKILEIAGRILGGFLEARADVRGVGVTGQMHGILYVDRKGRALSPLYTWQDGRGDQPRGDGTTHASLLSKAFGRQLSTGMGAVTHHYNAAHGLVPPDAAWLCAIPDYVAMTLGRATAPRMDTTLAASLGCFDLEGLDFMRGRMEKQGIDPGLFPEVADDYPALGEARPGVPVFAALGDNQASFIGSVRDVSASLLVNIGTGGQVSLRVDSPEGIPGIDIRPLPYGEYLAVGAALCGGKAYSLLRDFFLRTVRLFAGAEADVDWETMNAIEAESLPGRLVVDTRFSGTRSDPLVRGRIDNIGVDTFTPEHLVVGVREGIAAELLDFFERVPRERRARIATLVGSGNAIRMNPALRLLFAQRIGMPMHVPAHREEASFGAALIAGIAAGVLPDLRAAGELVTYTRS